MLPRDHVIDNAQLKLLRHKFVPAGFPNNRRVDPPSSRQWASHDPLRPIPEKPNDKARWSTRILRPGIFELLLTIGHSEGDDPTIGLELHRLEAEIVDAVTRLADLAVDVGFSGPTLLAASLHGLDQVIPYAGHGTGGFGRRRDLTFPAVVLPSLVEVNALAIRQMLDGLWFDAGFEDGSPSFSSGAWAGEGNPGPYRLD